MSMTATARMALERHRQAIENERRSDTYVCPRTAREVYGHDLTPQELEIADKGDTVVGWFCAIGLVIVCTLALVAKAVGYSDEPSVGRQAARVEASR